MRMSNQPKPPISELVSVVETFLGKCRKLGAKATDADYEKEWGKLKEHLTILGVADHFDWTEERF